MGFHLNYLIWAYYNIVVYFCYIWVLHIKQTWFWLWILGLYIKLGLNYRKLSLGLIKFILICYIWVWLIVLILWLLIWKFWIRAYDMWDIFVGLYLLILAHFNWWNLVDYCEIWIWAWISIVNFIYFLDIYILAINLEILD